MLRKFKEITESFFFGIQKITYTPFTAYLGEHAYRIRELSTADIKELLAIERDVYNGHLPWSKGAFLSELKSPIDHLYLGVAYKGRLIGFAGCRIVAEDAHITNIAIQPHEQGKGIGTLLIDELEKFAIMNRCTIMSLEVRVSNLRAQRLYEKLGFESREIKPAYYNEKNEDALNMVKYLGRVER